MVVSVIASATWYTLVLIAVSRAVPSQARRWLTCSLASQQTVVLALSADSNINTFPVAYSWLYFANRLLMCGVAGIAEPFFLWRATKVSVESLLAERTYVLILPSLPLKASTSRFFKWTGLVWLVLTCFIFLVSHALVARDVVAEGQPWSFESSIVECTLNWVSSSLSNHTVQDTARGESAKGASHRRVLVLTILEPTARLLSHRRPRSSAYEGTSASSVYRDEAVSLCRDWSRGFSLANLLLNICRLFRRSQIPGLSSALVSSHSQDFPRRIDT
jgi:hypothetical protein